MWQKLQGLIIRNRRQEREWSQAALCTGICEVSYLSRIERGKVEGSSEVLDLLFQRLGIQWRDDPDFAGRHLSGWKIAMTACLLGNGWRRLPRC